MTTPTLNIDALQSGPELNAQVAEHVMGWKWLNPEGAAVIMPPDYKSGKYGSVIANAPDADQYTPRSREWDCAWAVLPRYSEDIASAWGVFMHFLDTHKGIYHTQRSSLGWTLGQPMEWHCTIGATNTVIADTAPLAICRAALKAVLR